MKVSHRVPLFRDLQSWWQRWPSASESISSLPDCNVCALTWAHRMLDDQKDVGGFLDRLESEISKRGFGEEEVLATRGSAGPFFGWRGF